ncbi:MAG: response regulator transcription factor [Roseivirga sp.]|nr:response regulator transcription factor [Roseivirga sp.]
MEVVIIEDESKSALKLEKYLKAYNEDIHITAILPSVRESIEYFRNNPEPNLIFLDIQLADGPSFNIFEELQIEAFVIFLTAYEEFALRAFDLNSLDYILKPFTESDVARGLKKYESMVLNRAHRRSARSSAPREYRSRFLVRKGQQIHTLKTSDIAYFYKDEVVILVKHDGTTFLYDATLEELEDELDPISFFRINRQYLVNYPSIKSLSPGSSNRYQLSLEPKSKQDVYVSQSKVPALKTWLTS